jgi:hypothetical protein
MLHVALIKSVSPVRLTIWLIGRLFGNTNFGGIVKTYSGHEVVLKKAAEHALFDDSDYTLKTPLLVRGGEYEVTLVVPPSRRRVSWRKLVLLRFKLLAAVFRERVRNRLRGRPSYRNSQLTKGVYVGGQFTPKAYKVFKRWGVNAIISLRSKPPYNLPKQFTSLHLPTKDWTAPSVEQLQQGVLFIESQLKNGNGVYIHCRRGEGRGPTMAAAYLIYSGLSVEEALQRVKQARPASHPTRSQIRRLAEWQKFCS